MSAICGARGIRDPLTLQRSRTSRILLRIAVSLALPLLTDGRDEIVACHTLILPDGTPDLSTLDPEVTEIVAEYDRAIGMCSAALTAEGDAP